MITITIFMIMIIKMIIIIIVITLLLFERSEFLIDTSQKKSLRVCPCARVK